MPELVVDTPRRKVIPAPPGRRPLPVPAATVALALLMAAAALLLLYAGRRLTFFYDEWNFITLRRGGSLDSYLAPHNGHLSLFPVLVYKALFATVGLRSYFPYRLVTVALHLLCAGLLYVIARRRLGPVGGLLPAGLLLFLGTAWQDLLWPFQIGYFGSIAGGLGALAVLDADPLERVWPAAALLTWSVSSSGVGIPYLVAAAALLLVRRAPWRHLWVIAVPVVVYIAWYIGWGGGDQTSRSAILGAPQYIANAAAGAVAGIAGLDPTAWGPPLAVAAVVMVALAWRRRGTAVITPMFAAALLGAVVFWGLTAIVRAGPAEPAASRYIYVGGVFVLLLGVEAARGIRWTTGWLPLAAVAVIGVFVANINVLRDGEGGLRASDDSVRASLAAVQIAAPIVPASFEPDPTNAPQLTAGDYLRAERDLGSPAPSISQLAASPESFRARSDIVLAHAESLRPGSQSGLSPALIRNDALYGAVAVRQGACERILPRGALASLDVTLPSGTAISIRAQPGARASVYVRRFASAFAPPTFTTVAGGASASVGFPRDLASQVPWHVQVVDPVTFSVCPA
jgi:hypothetical protein